MPERDAPEIAVCVATYRRPAGLERLLRALAAQRLGEPAATFEVIVVDNDPAASARETCDRWQRGSALRLRRLHEPRPTIPVARNAALAAVGPDTGWLAFVDDDEVPGAGWLEALLGVARASGADVVSGPVVPHFMRPAPGWALELGCFASPRYPTGSPRPVAYTNNALLRAALVREQGLRFDERLPFGEDTELFERIRLRGGRIVWCDAAEVKAWIPAERLRAQWWIARRVLHGRADAQIARLRGGLAVPTVLARLLGKTLSGPLTLLAAPLLGRPRLIEGLGKLGYAAGAARGLALPFRAPPVNGAADP